MIKIGTNEILNSKSTGRPYRVWVMAAVSICLVQGGYAQHGYLPVAEVESGPQPHKIKAATSEDDPMLDPVVAVDEFETIDGQVSRFGGPSPFAREVDGRFPVGHGPLAPNGKFKIAYPVLDHPFLDGTGNLLYWNGEDRNEDGVVDQLDVEFSHPPDAATVTMNHSELGDLATLDGSKTHVDPITFDTLGDNGARGGHFHLRYDVVGDDAETDHEAPNGIYLFANVLSMDGFKNSDNIWTLLAKGVTEAGIAAADAVLRMIANSPFGQTPPHVTKIGLSNSESGDQDVTEYVEGETVHITVQDVQIHENGHVLALLRQEEMRVVTDLETQGNGTFRGEQALEGFHVGPVKVFVYAYDTEHHTSLSREGEIHIVEESSPFEAYNDLSWGQGQLARNITLYTTDHGQGRPIMGSSGRLIDHASGEDLPVVLTVEGGSWDGVNHVTQGATSVFDTDAYDVFNGIIDATGVISYEGNEPIRLTLEGLDPSLAYEIILFGNRDRSQYVARHTEVTLSGASTFTNSSSEGAERDGAHTTLRNGYNTPTGYVARYSEVHPGTDGTVAITCVGAGEDPKVYLNALCLRASIPEEDDGGGHGHDEGEGENENEHSDGDGTEGGHGHGA